MSERTPNWRHHPKQKYVNQKSHAKQRGIPWEFTFESWWAMWEPYWKNRGRLGHQYCMCRNGDTGPYSPDNCRIDTNNRNQVEAGEVKAVAESRPIPASRKSETRKGRPHTKTIAGIYWHERDKVWSVEITVNKKKIHLGTYRDWFDAVCARKSAENRHWLPGRDAKPTKPTLRHRKIHRGDHVCTYVEVYRSTGKKRTTIRLRCSQCGLTHIKQTSTGLGQFGGGV